MLDLKFIRQNPEIVKKAAKDKRVEVDVNQLLVLDERRRHVLVELETKRAEQNKKSDSKPSPEEITLLKKLKEGIKILEEELRCVNEELQILLFKVPNIPSVDTPVGADETGNKVLRQWGSASFLRK